MQDVKEKFYYIEAAGNMSTRIGKTLVMPKEAPTRLTEKQYNAFEHQILHYERHNVIMVSRPGSASSARAAKTIKEETVRLEEVHAGGKPPPAPMVRVLGVVPEDEASEIKTFSAPGKPDAEDKCWAVTASGNRCKNVAEPDLLVCKIHLAMLKRGKEVRDEDDNRITDDGKAIDA